MFIHKHCIKDHLGQLWEFKVLNSLLSHSQLIVRAQGLKVLRERRQEKGNPTPVPLTVATTYSTISLVLRERGKSMEGMPDNDHY